MRKLKLIFLSISVLLWILTGCEINHNQNIIVDETKVSVHFIDVGQGDCELLLLPNNQVMLIDGGTEKSGVKVIKYLKKLNIKRIDYIIGTHPHEDHIGGLSDIINSFEIGSIYMPRVSHNTQNYKELLKTIQNKNLNVNTAKAGASLISENDLSINLVAPNDDYYEEMNDYSAVVLLRFKNTKMLFTGDIEKTSEDQIMLYHQIKADLLKVAHHGSSSSTSQKFLRAVSPKVAVICVGTGNDYGHPTLKTLDRLQNIKTYRTDLNGTIVASSDGEKIEIKTEKEGSN